jgi:hypothetical protein
MSTYGREERDGREERADPAEPDRVSAAGADAIGEHAEAQAARKQLGPTASQVAPRGEVAGVAAAGEVPLDTRADRPMAARPQERIGEPALLLGLLSRDREVVRVEGAHDLDGRARRARIRRGTVQAGKREVWVLLDCHVEFPIVLS